MFERFTERAREVAVLAQEEARTLKHIYIGTEHILLGLVRENEGVAARILLDFEKFGDGVIRMLSTSAPRQDADTMCAHDGVAHTGAASERAVPDLGTLTTRRSTTS